MRVIEGKFANQRPFSAAALSCFPADMRFSAAEEVKEEPAEQKKGKLAYIPDVEEMKAMTVDKLRALARKLEITNMTRKEIRFANKTELIERILEFLEKENK